VQNNQKDTFVDPRDFKTCAEMADNTRVAISSGPDKEGFNLVVQNELYCHQACNSSTEVGVLPCFSKVDPKIEVFAAGAVICVAVATTRTWCSPTSVGDRALVDRATLQERLPT
jgi:hypothetical protein